MSYPYLHQELLAYCSPHQFDDLFPDCCIKRVISLLVNSKRD